MSDNVPRIGTKWKHRRGGRVCKVVNIDAVIGKIIVEYRYVRTVGGMGQNRTTPPQRMSLLEWRGLFTEEVL